MGNGRDLDLQCQCQNGGHGPLTQNLRLPATAQACSQAYDQCDQGEESRCQCNEEVPATQMHVRSVRRYYGIKLLRCHCSFGASRCCDVLFPSIGCCNVLPFWYLDLFRRHIFVRCHNHYRSPAAIASDEATVRVSCMLKESTFGHV